MRRPGPGHFPTLALALAPILCAGCGGLDARSGDGGSTRPVAQGVTAGYVSLPPRTIHYQGFGFLEDGITSAAQIFYSLVPARENTADKPILVFINGGPGAATSTALATWGTGPVTMSESGEVVVNPADFSTLGSLLYIDTKQAGFSFDEVSDPSNEALRSDMFTFINFSLHSDAADILLTLLSVLADHPELEDNPIVMVGESYGGARSAMMLSFARHPSALLDGSAAYRDPALAAALLAHFSRVSSADPDVVAAIQFNWQILIQPGMVLPGTGAANELCAHLPDGDPRASFCANPGTFDPLDIRKPSGFFDRHTLLAQKTLMHDDGFSAFFGLLPSDLALFTAENRQHAFRFTTCSSRWDAADFPQMPLGHCWDAHHISFYRAPYDFLPVVFDPDTGEPLNPEYDTGDRCASAFVRSLAEVHTLITNAYYDGTVDSTLFPQALLQWNQSLDRKILHDARLLSDVDPAVVRPGWMELTFAGTEFVREGETRLIRMPQYLDAGHMVTLYQAVDLLEDVRAFLVASGPQPTRP